jgi:hypothetical protein
MFLESSKTQVRRTHLVKVHDASFMAECRRTSELYGREKMGLDSHDS